MSVDAPRLSLRLTIQTADNASAKALHELFGKGAKALGRSKEVRAAVPGLDKVLPLLAPKVVGDRLELALDEKALVPLLRPHITGAVEAREREKSSKSLHTEHQHIWTPFIPYISSHLS